VADPGVASGINVGSPVDRARRALESAVGPPYRKVEDLVPRPVEEQGLSGNVALEEWRWGSMSPSLTAGLDRWMLSHVAPAVGKALDGVPESVTGGGHEPVRPPEGRRAKDRGRPAERGVGLPGPGDGNAGWPVGCYRAG
jgi:hypothetical protein